MPSDDEAVFDRELAIDGTSIEPMVTWGTSPEDAVPIGALVPDPQSEADAQRRENATTALAYMDLRPGQPLEGLAIDRVFIGSCTNSRIEDLRAAAAVLRGRKAAVPAMIVPGSTQVKRQAEAEGLDRIFREAGAEWLHSGCSMCVAMNATWSRRTSAAPRLDRISSAARGRIANTFKSPRWRLPPRSPAATDVRRCRSGLTCRHSRRYGDCSTAYRRHIDTDQISRHAS